MKVHLVPLALAGGMLLCGSAMAQPPAPAHAGHAAAGHKAPPPPPPGRPAPNPMVGGAPMLPTKDIIDNAMMSRDHTTLVAAVKAAGLVETLKGPGPFTVFAPTNAAFAKLPKGTVDTLLKPANKAKLTKILTYHVVPGRLTAADLETRARAGGGKAKLTTAEGQTLTAWKKGMDWYVTDVKGGSAKITTANVMQSNGVIHVVDTVLMP